MEQVFMQLVRMSVYAGLLVIAVLVLRLALKKAPRWMVCLLWVLVAVRLVLPVSIPSRVSLMPAAETVERAVRTIPAIPQTAEPTIPAEPDADAQEAPKAVNYAAVLSRVWLAGMAGMLLWAAWSDLRLRRRLRTAILQGGNIWLSDAVATPFVLGIFRARIYLPVGLDPRQAVYVLAHEHAHIQRRDHWWKPLGWLLLSVYWFQPLLWVAYVCFCRDLELACDERVARSLDREGLADYSQALLDCSHPRAGTLVCPVAFGEAGVRQRVRSILRYKKPARWVVLIAAIAVIAAAVLLLTNRPGEDFQSYFDRYQRAVLAGDREGAAELRWFENDTKRQMYLDGFQQPESFAVTDKTRINDDLWVFVCEEKLPELPESVLYQFVGRDGGRLWIYANVNQIPEALTAGLNRSLYDYHEDENVMFADEDEQLKALMEADERALIAAFPETDGADAELVIARLAEYYRADPEGVTRLIDENALSEEQKSLLLRGIQAELEAADEIVSVGGTVTASCKVMPDGRARAPMLLQPEHSTLRVTVAKSPAPPEVVRLYDASSGEVTSFAEIAKIGDTAVFRNLAGESYVVEIVLPEGTPEGETVSLQISE